MRDHVLNFHFEVQCDECEEKIKGQKAFQKHKALKHLPPPPEVETVYLDRDGLLAPADKETGDQTSDNPSTKSDTLKMCGQCKKYKTADFNMMREHVLYHHLEVTCDVCGDTFTGLNELKKHTIKKHEETPRSFFKIPKPFSCKQCDFVSNTRKNIKRHVIKRHNPNKSMPVKVPELTDPLLCDQCEYFAQSEALLEKHIRNKHAMKECPECHKSIPRVKYNDHYISAHTDETFNCDQCSYVGDGRVNLARHKKRRHIHIAILPCPHCEYQGNNSALGEHIRLKHRGLPALTCSECSFQTFSKFNMKTHMARSHPAPDAVKFSCAECEAVYPTQKQIKEHVKRKHMGNAFKCDKCKYETNDKSKFRDHQIYVHTDVEKKFACEICNFRTAQKINLKKHVEYNHSENQTQYQCDHCQYVTRNKGHLKVHTQRMHLGEKYGCEECSYEATTPARLKAHVKSTHDNQNVEFDTIVFEY